MKLISVIIPVYNTEKYLVKCVDSFIAQSYSNLEIILVDDGSTDSSGLLCDELKSQDSRIKVVHKTNGGLSEARNVGLANSTGDFITFYDSDDYVDKDYIMYLSELKEKNNVQIACCAYNVSNESGDILFKIQGEIPEVLLDKTEFLRRMLLEDGITVSACFKLYDRTLFKEVSFPVGKLYEDNGTTYKIIDRCSTKIAYGNKPFGYYVMHSHSITRSRFSERKLDMIELTDEMCDFLDARYPQLECVTKRRRIYARFNVLRQMGNVDSQTISIRKTLKNYILSNRRFLLSEKCVPKRDKIATLLLSISDRLFFSCWNIYRNHRYGK